jgi:hypothetical protein
VLSFKLKEIGSQPPIYTGTSWAGIKFDGDCGWEKAEKLKLKI